MSVLQKRLVSGFLLIGILVIAPMSLAGDLAMRSNGGEICPAINCDCSTLPTEKWVQVCRQYEAHIKDECAANANTPKNYCSIHGEKGFPVALAIEPSREKAADIAVREPKEVEKKIEVIVWALQSDLSTAEKMIEKTQFAKASQMLKLIENNLDNVFQYYESLEAAIIVSDKNEDAKQKAISKLWVDYSDKVLEFAVNMEKFSSMLEVDVKHAETPKLRKIYGVLATRAFRVTGKAYEHGGYSYGKALDHEDAAKSWRLAADVSVHLVDFGKTNSVSDSGLRYNELQAAARLQRASYHWMLENEEEGANALLQKSQVYVDHEQQKKLEILVDDNDEIVASGGLSSR